MIQKDIKIIESQFLGEKKIFVAFVNHYDQLTATYQNLLSGESANLQSDFDKKTKATYQKTQASINQFLDFAKTTGENFLKNSEAQKTTSLQLFFIISSIIVLVVVLLAFYNTKTVISPLNYAKKSAEEVASGNLNTEFKTDGDSEISDTLRSMQKIVDNIKKAASFTEEIGQGNYDIEFEPVGENDTLGHSLIDMQNKLKAVAKEDELRNWATKGLAIFADILRNDKSDMNEFGQEIISKIIQYSNANQGGLFLLNDMDPKDPKMELIAAYAYERNKLVEKEVRKGEGLVGQSWQENDKIILKKVPQNYINIVSGLGDANPSSVLIIPLKENEDVYGMLEIASFKAFEDHQIDFLEQLSKSIGATFKSLKVNIQTNRMLEESREMQEMMSQQEEELRQTAEEMTATAEQSHIESERHKTEMNKIIKELNARIGILDSMCLVSETDKKGVIQKINKKFIEVAQYTEAELIDQPQNIVRHPDMPAEVWKACWATIGKGDVFRGIVKNKAKDGSAYWVDAVIAPKLGEDGKPDGYIGVRYDITEQITKFETYTMEVGGETFTIPTK